MPVDVSVVVAVEGEEGEGDADGNIGAVGGVGDDDV